MFIKCFVLLTVLWSASISQAQSLVTFESKNFEIGQESVTLEIADNDTRRMQGLMHRTFLAPNHGMLFVFPKPYRASFWMKNTPLALDIAFVNACGTIINIQSMTPFSQKLHTSPEPIWWAIEMKKGWFTEKKIGIGQKINRLKVPGVCQH